MEREAECHAPPGLQTTSFKETLYSDSVELVQIEGGDELRDPGPICGHLSALSMSQNFENYHLTETSWVFC